ncbi:DctP family TRAP transporter solute-binding subunit [Sporosarcina sp. 179-K 8C2 HS]|uniref:DctP family TRAP transporter solute-binding subunit n=1 Tax=Sporosarcina sp. 179-K 8C2 HS TaxID=3142387 RepID=UPI0039A21992
MKVNKKKWLIGVAATILSFSLVGCTQKEKTDADSSVKKNATVLKLAHFQPGNADQPKHAAALAFESYVEKHTNGAIDVQIYPASQLGDEKTILENLKMNTVQMTIIHDGPISSVFAPMGVYNLPYLFNNQGEAWTVYDSEFTKDLGEEMRQATGIRLLGMADNGVRHFTNNKKEIKSIEDMRGLKMRVQPGPLFENMMKATGASPSVISWPELPSALQQGVVDGQENGVTNILAASLYESQKYVTLDSHIFSYHAYLVSDKFHDSLTKEQQKVIQEGVDLVKWIHRGMTSSQDMNAGAILAGKGMTVTTISENEIEKFRQVTQPAVAEWLRKEADNKWVDGILNEIESLQSGN